MTKVLLRHNTLDHVMILTNAIHALTVHHTDLLIDRLIDTILALDIDHAPILETIIFQDIKIHTDHLPDQEILDFLDLVHTNTLEIKINTTQPQDQTDSVKLEVHMYHPTAMANAVTPTSWFYTLYVHTPSIIIQKDSPSRLEIAFLLDSGASTSVLNYPTCITPTKLLDTRPNHTSDIGPPHTSKTLNVANQTEVPILHYANIILNTSIDDTSRYLSPPFAVSDVKYNILGTIFFEGNIKNINIQDFTLEFKYPSKTHPNYAKFTTLLSKEYPYFSYIYRINSKTQIQLKPKSCKYAHFPIKNLLYSSFYNHTTKPLLPYNTTHLFCYQVSYKFQFH